MAKITQKTVKPEPAPVKEKPMKQRPTAKFKRYQERMDAGPGE